ncbi:MAG: UDP-N-acetylglucosamine 2-epimerase, partial [Candidatus Bathyarchaeota archaeon]
VTGNTIVDAIFQNLEEIESSETLEKLGLHPKKYFVATIHRQENVDNKERFSRILNTLKKISKEFNRTILYPIHPRSKKRMKIFGLTSSEIRLIHPLGFTSFLQLEKNAELVLTDSGGVQEETCILKVPCVTLRDNTERPETLDIGSNILAGTEQENIIRCTEMMLSRDNDWKNPFGDGKAGKRIVEILMDKFD